MRHIRFKSVFILLSTLLLALSCKNDDDQIITPPIIETNVASYVFATDGVSSVDVSDQNVLADMLKILSEYSEQGHTGEIVEAFDFRAIFENKGDNGSGLFDFESTVRLEDLLFIPDLNDDYFGDLFEQAAITSKAGGRAAERVPGLIVRTSTGSDILVNNLGQAFTAFIEKGIMGSVFLHQILNVYLTDEFVGDTVDNLDLVVEKNYTALEHNWDIAFGFFQAPGDFGSNFPASRVDELRYWSTYCNLVDPVLGNSDKIMDAFRDGRNAIVNNDLETKNNSRAILYDELELLAAATTIHYINQSMTFLAEDQQGDMLYSLSNAYMFARALNMNPKVRIPNAQLHNILNVDFGIGGDFWTVNAEGLENAKEKLVEVYPSLEEVKDQL